MIKGRNIYLAIDGTPIAASTGCNIEVAQEFLDVCSPVEGRWVRKVPSTASWSASFDCLCRTMADANAIIGKITSGEEIEVRLYDKDRQINRGGSAFVSSASITAQVGSLVKMAVSLVGSGELAELLTPSRTSECIGEYFTILDNYAQRVELTGSSMYSQEYRLSGSNTLLIDATGGCCMYSTDELLDATAFDEDEFALSTFGAMALTNTKATITVTGNLYIIDTRQTSSTKAVKVYKK